MYGVVIDGETLAVAAAVKFFVLERASRSWIGFGL
jgi:hypothetical protein